MSMLKKIFPYLGMCLVVLSTSQCMTKCQVNPVKNTTNLSLQWQEEGKPLELPGLDLTKDIQGKVCYIPSEDASYFIDLQGKAWKFTRTSEGKLEAQAISNIGTTFQPGEIFAFAAGTKEQQNLFVGKINPVPGGSIQLWKYEGTTWQPISHTSGTIKNSLFSNTLNWCTQVGSCSWEDNGQIYGCVTIALQIGGNFSTGILVFDPTSAKFKSLNPVLPSLGGQVPIVATSPQPNKILLGLGYGTTVGANLFSANLFSILSIADNKVTMIPKDIKNEESYNITEGFTLQLEDELPITEAIFYALQADNYKFLRLDVKNRLVSAGDLANTTFDKKTLILPFSKEVYCITLIPKEEDQKQPGYYQAKLQLAPQQPAKK
jgi:hypothetical protein